MARKHAAASNGATGPNAKAPTSTFLNNPETMATKPLPRNIAWENVTDSHCWSKLLWKMDRETTRYDESGR